MKVINEALLKEIRERCRCEYCGKEVRTGLHPHHVKARGMGGGFRLDIWANLLGVCPACHYAIHDGHISLESVLAAVALREGVTPDEIQHVIHCALYQRASNERASDEQGSGPSASPP